MNDNPVQRDMELNKLLDEYKEKLEDAKREIAQITRDYEAMLANKEHEADGNLDVIEKMHKISMEG